MKVIIYLLIYNCFDHSIALTELKKIGSKTKKKMVQKNTFHGIIILYSEFLFTLANFKFELSLYSFEILIQNEVFFASCPEKYFGKLV